MVTCHPNQPRLEGWEVALGPELAPPAEPPSPALAAGNGVVCRGWGACGLHVALGAMTVGREQSASATNTEHINILIRSVIN